LIAKNKTRVQLNRWYNRIDGLICASKAEGGPMCLLEAGICKTPIITTRVGIGREFINNSTAFPVKASAEDIARGIKAFKSSNDRAKEKSEKLYEIIKKRWTYKAKSYEMKKALDFLCNK
jgi:glycosyltransferase involved in cell wall biosynthesis